MTKKRRDVPAEPEFWIFIFGDLSVFTVFFFYWAIAQHAHNTEFATGRATLNQLIGVVNTALLLTSSAVVAAAVRLLRIGGTVWARRCYLVAIAGGSGFIALKVLEYYQHFSHGLGALRGVFFLNYFVFTGVHAMHVLLGLSCLVFVYAKASRATGGRGMFAHEAIATYWHMIDAVWIVLFSLIYLT